jgi:hypothetical protein
LIVVLATRGNIHKALKTLWPLRLFILLFTWLFDNRFGYGPGHVQFRKRFRFQKCYKCELGNVSNKRLAHRVRFRLISEIRIVSRIGHVQDWAWTLPHLAFNTRVCHHFVLFVLFSVCSDEALFMLATCYYRSGKPVRASSLLESKGCSTPQCKYLMARCCLDTNKYVNVLFILLSTM